MKLNDYDEGTGGRFASGAAALAVLLIVSVIIIVLVANKDYLKRKFGSDSSSVTTSVSETSAQASSSTGASNSEVFVSDLSFYKDYEDRSSSSASDSNASDTSERNPVLSSASIFSSSLSSRVSVSRYSKATAALPEASVLLPFNSSKPGARLSASASCTSIILFICASDFSESALLRTIVFSSFLQISVEIRASSLLSEEKRT